MHKILAAEAKPCSTEANMEINALNFLRMNREYAVARIHNKNVNIVK